MLANGQRFLSFLAEKPEISYFHCARPLAFNCVVHNACVVVLSTWMGVGGCGCPGFLSVDKQRTKFRLSGKCWDKLRDSTRNMNVSIEPDRFAVTRQASKEKISTCT